MTTITKDSVKSLIDTGNMQVLLAAFDEDPDKVRRNLIRLTYTPDSHTTPRAIEALRYLTQERSDSMDLFFKETMRRQLWAMNEEGGNIPWCAPEIIGAVIAGNPQKYAQFFSYNFYAAIEEMSFQPSLVHAYDFVSSYAPEVTAEFTEQIEDLRSKLGNVPEHKVRHSV